MTLQAKSIEEVERLEPEVALMLRVQRDEPGAFAELIDLYWPRIFGKFFRQLRDRQEAEDLVQDVFLRIFRNRKRYRPQAKFATWLFHIARNVARNEFRSRCRRLATPAGLLEEMDDSPSFQPRTDADRPSRPLERDEVTRLVRSAVAGLKDRPRAAIELQCQDHSYVEIADALDLTPKATKSLLYRARNQLRESLAPFADVFA